MYLRLSLIAMLGEALNRQGRKRTTKRTFGAGCFYQSLRHEPV